MATTEEMKAELASLYVLKGTILRGEKPRRVSHGTSGGANRFAEFPDIKLGDLNVAIKELEGKLGIGGRTLSRRVVSG